ncbi:MAG: metallophosphoesterase [Verrucomicrobia bacterium]|nr:metallophosphoesterase [Verrucomicrobiota bacterium]
MPITLPPLTRRQFLSRSLIGGAGLLLGSCARLPAGRRADPHTWALLSDTHIAADRAKVARNIAMAAHLEAVVRDVLAQPVAPAAAIVNGDLAYNTGESTDYATFAALIAPLRAAALPLHLALGNHDHRERFWTALADDATARRPLADRQVARVAAERANWFILDSLDQTNKTPGRFGEAQLAWLARELDAHTDRPALVVTHHNPTTDPTKVSIIDEAALYAVLQPRRQVKAHLFGHSHVWSVKTDATGLHRINLPATAYVFDAAQPAGWVIAQLAPRGVKLHLRCVDPTRKDHGEVKELTWRV